MKTTDMLINAERVRNQTAGLTRAQELKWLVDTFSIDEILVLRLLGYSRKQIEQLRNGGVSFVALAARKQSRTIWATELFRDLIDKFGYDIDRLSAYLKTPAFPPGTPIGQSIKSKTEGKATGPPKRLVSVRILRQGGPNVVGHLADYLRSPAIANGS